ncbi:MAG TPA: hypothetical protein VHE83_03555 [Mycobacteriales bacterium]|nr:hypothetical protein [Mycobacteriales bacterium]
MSCRRRGTVAATFVAAAISAVVAACGTTVPQAERVATFGSAPAAEQGLGPPATVGTPAAGAPSTSATDLVTVPQRLPPVAGLPPASTGSGRTPPGPTSSRAHPVGAPSSTAAARLADGPGVTPTTISIGLLYSGNTQSANAALGANVSSTDAKADATAYINYLNAHGGFGGRKVVLEADDISSSSTEPASQIATDACTFFTQDHHVFAVIYEVLAISVQTTFNSCLAKAGVLPLGATTAVLGDQDFAAVPTYLDTVTYTAQGAMRNLVDSFARTGYLTTRWDTGNGRAGGALPVKLGVLYPDVPSWSDAINHILLPALSTLGVPVASNDVVSVTFPNTTSDDGALVSQIQAAVLKFRADNVTDVIPAEVNTLAFFAAGADPQGYRPRYALTSANEAAEGVRSGIVPARQLTGATGVGWLPALDLANPGQYRPPGRPACLAVMNAAGLTFADAFAEGTPMSECDQLGLLKRAVDGLGAARAVTAPAVAAAIEHGFPGFASAEVIGGSFTPTRHYQTAQGWLYSYDPSCSCMAYTSAAFPLR